MAKTQKKKFIGFEVGTELFEDLVKYKKKLEKEAGCDLRMAQVMRQIISQQIK